MRIKINYDSKNQTIDKVARHNFEACASKQADNGENGKKHVGIGFSFLEYELTNDFFCNQDVK